MMAKTSGFSKDGRGNTTNFLKMIIHSTYILDSL
jgi:hypothetical protein